MATKKKPELDIEIPAGSKKLTVKSKKEPQVVIPVPEKVVAKTATKETAVKSNEEKIIDQLQTLNDSIAKLNAMFYSSDWKLWKIMSMIEMIAKENGYSFSIAEETDSKEKETSK